VYISSLHLMAMYEERIRDHPDRRALQPGRARGPRIRPWATRARTALRERWASGAASAGAEAAGVRP
jgi:hypothetical protein